MLKRREAVASKLPWMLIREPAALYHSIQVLGINLIWFVSIISLRKLPEWLREITTLELLRKLKRSLIVFSITVFSGRKEISVQLLSYEDLIFPHRVRDFPSHLIFVQFKNMGKWRRPSPF